MASTVKCIGVERRGNRALYSRVPAAVSECSASASPSLSAAALRSFVRPFDCAALTALR